MAFQFLNARTHPTSGSSFFASQLQLCPCCVASLVDGLRLGVPSADHSRHESCKTEMRFFSLIILFTFRIILSYTHINLCVIFISYSYLQTCWITGWGWESGIGTMSMQQPLNANFNFTNSCTPIKLLKAQGLYDTC
jgi:hypothetical protein